MENCFYITETSENWYQLRTKESHSCICCGRELDKILEKVVFYTKKHKNSGEIEKKMRKINYGKGRKVSEEQLEYYKKMEIRDSDRFKTLIEEAITAGMEQKKGINRKKAVKKEDNLGSISTKKEKNGGGKSRGMLLFNR